MFQGGRRGTHCQNVSKLLSRSISTPLPGLALVTDHTVNHKHPALTSTTSAADNPPRTDVLCKLTGKLADLRALNLLLLGHDPPVQAYPVAKSFGSPRHLNSRVQTQPER